MPRELSAKKLVHVGAVQDHFDCLQTTEDKIVDNVQVLEAEQLSFDAARIFNWRDNVTCRDVLQERLVLVVEDWKNESDGQ